jgi:hypothetical protein
MAPCQYRLPGLGKVFETFGSGLKYPWFIRVIPDIHEMPRHG